ncbi:MAG: DUF4238 domain-containing protein [Acidobacteriia bacterium]|nr:DUF4238 domain-containing protein [Terriglobia bacterium]
MPKPLHHFVPRFYLRQFVDPTKKPRELLWVFMRGQSDPKLLPVDVVAARSDYYTIERRSGERTQVIEENLSRMEDLAAPVFAKIRENPSSLTLEEKGVFAFFIAFQYARVPKFRDEVESTASHLFGRLVEETAKDKEKFAESVRGALSEAIPDAEVEDLRQVVLKRELEPVARPELSLYYMLPAIVQIIGMLNRMHWAFRPAHPSVPLVTSDNPCILNNPSLLPGAGPPRAEQLEITFPASPELLFIATWDRHAGEGRMTPFLTRQVNKLIATAADRFVYSPENIPAVSKYLASPSKHQLPDPDTLWRQMTMNL